MTTQGIIDRCGRGLWYLASPYSHDSEAVRRERYGLACSAAARLIMAGVSVIPPIVITHPLVAHGLPAMDLSFYLEYERLMIRRCEGVIVLKIPGWLDSVGVTSEIDYAASIGWPVVYWTWEREKK